MSSNEINHTHGAAHRIICTSHYTQTFNGFFAQIEIWKIKARETFVYDNETKKKWKEKEKESVCVSSD